MPYWKQQAVEMNQEQELVSVYAGKGYAAVVVMNLADVNRDVSLTIHPEAMGLSGTLSAENLEYDEAVSLTGNRLEIKNIPAKQYRVIMISTGKEGK